MVCLIEDYVELFFVVVLVDWVEVYQYFVVGVGGVIDVEDDDVMFVVLYVFEVFDEEVIELVVVFVYVFVFQMGVEFLIFRCQCFQCCFNGVLLGFGESYDVKVQVGFVVEYFLYGLGDVVCFGLIVVIGVDFVFQLVEVDWVVYEQVGGQCIGIVLV